MRACLIVITTAAVIIAVGVILKILYTTYNVVKWKKNDAKLEKEGLKMRMESIDKRLDCFSETVGKMNWELSEIKESLNDKNIRKRSVK